MRLWRRAHFCLGETGFSFGDCELDVCDGAHRLFVMKKSGATQELAACCRSTHPLQRTQRATRHQADLRFQLSAGVLHRSQLQLFSRLVNVAIKIFDCILAELVALSFSYLTNHGRSLLGKFRDRLSQQFV